VHKRYLLLFVVLLALLPESQAQYDPSFSHYWATETSFNPAAAGKDPKLNVSGAYNMTLTGFEHYPKTMFISADMPFYFIKAYHGAGVQVVNDVIGLFSHKKVSLQYAYKQRLLGGTLSIGLQGGLVSESFDGSGVDLEESSDPTFAKSEATGSGFDLGAGLYYQQRNWYVGLSAQHLTSPTIDLGETNELEIARTYYFMAGGNIRFRNTFLSIQPAVLGRTDGVAWRADVSARLNYQHEKRKLYLGVGYSPTNSVTIYLGGDFHGVNIGYSYEVYTNGVKLGNGSHELRLGYQTEMNLFKKGRNKHQSVRIL
jgi:type IX secretion system PorP/SprF family membrane protein